MLQGRRWCRSPLCLLLLHPLLLLPSASVPSNPYFLHCSEYLNCGSFKDINVTYPFRLSESPNYCGYPGYELNCNMDDKVAPLTITIGGEDYAVQNIYDQDRIVVVVDSNFMRTECPMSFTNISINTTLFNYTSRDHNLTVYVNCSFPMMPPGLLEIPCLNKLNRPKLSYYKVGDGPSTFLENLPGSCDMTAAVPVHSNQQFGEALKGGFGLTWSNGMDWCQDCKESGGMCGYNESRPGDHLCFCSETNYLDSCFHSNSKRNKGLIIGISVAGGFSAAIVSSFCFLMYKKEKKRRGSTSTVNRIVSFQPFSKSDPELGSSLHAPIFKYDELYEATNGFDGSRELGDGGFGTVYKGKLRDGRVVAVKRLYETNYRRVEQFMNEVNILSLLRHHNLVSLYGCTSRHSRELLLVYEFVPNGTVADHLHGSRASESFLPWQVRMTIAIETADALRYLHSVEPQIIHRDIKTNNLLLDNNFHVKVADFGLSRLFPLDATHVSTAPQGTPGYVDPEYHQCYQLTDKSDVYSFGVVLMELISSKPAVDVTRQRNEINLAKMAIDKIQRQELHEFVDQKLGYQSDYNISRMINQVAELAFQCLQTDREMRPSIKDVLDVLTEIESGGRKNGSCENVNAAVKEEARLLKSSPPHSPNSVTTGWLSMETTPNTSG
ncbi:LEAF RUST 10 DISEASE-RESISTANCE LOCUS RECEPTOR-LIKE PROTEIN KINASE-like 1.2 isoform X2 [Phalaenopsis equestris]|uniref:LEAF RUST 10 DISEASE-RESISTANCE LOCUS RECEPTOR-LIKE PROTEIN KINASE-like 1.2 isoform X2 n=1 Tax=Phalaenopsis equestris TaxID=78828 RepID=UPI0009E3FDB5|nr:LEAF RUST 10 DISEASE-RESISTANCE LOCUS RECEPTOR-LIKE PROTEIN KINASE-like 1.2 isoform X2 [Phalaenopsis equestris]